MYLNTFSAGLEPLDMTGLEEFESLLRSARELGIDVPARTRYLSRNTVFRHQRFHFLEWGDVNAPPVVLLHGGNQSAHSWDLVSLSLSRHHHVLVPDQRGHGDSEWSRGAHYGIADMRDDAAAFLELCGPRRPVLVGHSMGGMVALALACARPDLLAGLVVVDIGPEVNERGARLIREFVGRTMEFDDLESFIEQVDKHDPYRSRAHIERTARYNLLRRADGRFVPKADRRRFLPPAPEADATAPRRLPGAPTLEQLAAVNLPILIIRGAESNVLEQSAAERFAAALARGDLAVVEGCGHNVASGNPRGFLAALQPFLEKLRRSAVPDGASTPG